MGTPYETLSEDFKEWLGSAGVWAEDFNAENAQGRVALKRAFNDDRRQLRQSQSQTSQADFRILLENAGVAVSEEVMRVLLKHYASSVVLVDTAEQAKDLYYEAAMLPRSATQIALREQNISVAELFRGSDPSKAILMHAFENGEPRILKIAAESSIQHELHVWNEVVVAAESEEHTAHLVPLNELRFQATTDHVGDAFGGSSAQAGVRRGLLMIHYQATLAQCKIPLIEEVLLRYGQHLYQAVSTMHKAGYCHLDIKPSNIFLFQGDCFLGDYGAAVKIGEQVRERTIKYFPKDGDFEAKEETDMYLLAMTLLEMYGTIPRASERKDSLTKGEIHDAIGGVQNEAVRHFLSSLFL